MVARSWRWSLLSSARMVTRSAASRLDGGSSNRRCLAGGSARQLYDVLACALGVGPGIEPDVSLSCPADTDAEVVGRIHEDPLPVRELQLGRRTSQTILIFGEVPQPKLEQQVAAICIIEYLLAKGSNGRDHVIVEIDRAAHVVHQ